MSEKNIKQAIITAIRAIPAGSASSYGAVASAAGYPGRARLVARILSEGEPSGLPWHRVVRASGHIAFPADSTQFAEQVQRLRAEGMEVRAGRVRLSKTEPDLDAQLWAPE
jgi:methylated-DNA-protein-cysteine methyltransferase-like protein